MANYVCTTVGTKNLLTGDTPCKAWVEYVPPVTPSFYPDLTAPQAQQIASSVALFLAVCAIYRYLRRVL